MGILFMHKHYIFRFILAVSVLFQYSVGVGQSRYTDSLVAIVNALPSDTNRVKTLKRLIFSLRDKDNLKAMKFAIQAKGISDSLQFKPGQAMALENMAWFHYRFGDFTKCIDHSMEALNLFTELNDFVGLAKCHNNIGCVLVEQKQELAAIQSFKKGLANALQANDYIQISRTYNNISYAFYRIEELDSASFYARKTLLLLARGNAKYLSGFAYRTLGDVNARRSNFDSAEYYYRKGIEFSRAAGNTFVEASILHRLGNTYLKFNKNSEAIDVLKQSLKVSSEGHYLDEMAKTYRYLADAYRGQKNFTNSDKYLRLHLNLRDSLDVAQQQEKISSIMESHAAEMNEVKIGLLNKEMQLKEEEIGNQRVWLYFSLGCLTLFLFLVSLLLINNRLRVRINSELSAKNRAIELQASELTRINRTKDKLFSILSHDLRSPLSSLRSLVDLVIMGQLSKVEFSELAVKLVAKLDSVTDDLNNLLMWTQSQMNGFAMNQEVVNLSEIVSKKVELVQDPAREKGIVINNNLQKDIHVLIDPNHLSLIIRNLLVNAVKFNKSGGSITITSVIHGNEVAVSVIDSGIGISSSDLEKLFNKDTHFTHLGTNQERGTGLGLMLVKEFVEKNGGTISVASELGKGSTFTFTSQLVRIKESESKLIPVEVS